jgi:cell division protein FtsI (penicillin-binding protein 3)
MAKPAARIVFLEAVLLVAGTAVLARSFWLQVVHHQVWVDKAATRRERDGELRARRGRIYDRNGQPLAVSQEQYHVTVSLNQVRDTAALQATLIAVLGLPKAKVAEQFRGDHPYFGGPFGAEQVESLRPVRGLHLEVLYRRDYPMDLLADRILGRLDEAGNAGIEGMEKALDTLLQGMPGRRQYLVDGKGRQIPVPGPPLAEPVAGQDVELTIDNDLQGIAEGALRHGVDTSNALGGDIVIIDVHTGELLAVASLRFDTVTHKIVSTSSAIVEPNEPGSTAKLFTVAALLRTGADTTPVNGEGGLWMQPISRGPPRKIVDVHPLHGMVTLGEMVKHSSNIAISKFSLNLTPEQQFEAIRDFGFGTAPGLGFPGEAPGKLRRPARWENRLLSQPSLGQGYEWEASSVQLAAAYAAIANHGVLMAPTLLREVRDEHGVVTWQHHPDTVRRAVPDSIAKHLFEYLGMTEGDGGTGSRAQLDRFPVPGKTGTAKVTSGGGYRASYAGIFPADDPQVVVYAMIDRPHGGKFFGGDVAAPIVKRVLQQALLAPMSPLDRRWLMEAASPVVAAAPIAAPEPAPVRRVVFPVVQFTPRTGPIAIPEVAGQTMRDAVFALQRAGFQARLVGHARVRNTIPAAGDSFPRGATVQINADSMR